MHGIVWSAFKTTKHAENKKKPHVHTIQDTVSGKYFFCPPMFTRNSKLE